MGTLITDLATGRPTADPELVAETGNSAARFDLATATVRELNAALHAEPEGSSAAYEVSHPRVRTRSRSASTGRSVCGSTVTSATTAPG